MFEKSVRITLILTYLVIIAGAVVRMTGSGMGCPDWPKCFGYYIPPTSEEQMIWHPNQHYHKGQIIIVEEALWVTKEEFVSTQKIDMSHFEKYTKHDYAEFNPVHTWVEYINRLTGALAGIAVFIMAIFSFSHWKKNKSLTLLSWLSVFLMGFQAWLGATVVYSVLAPVRITVHMVMALVIVAVLLYILHKLTLEKQQIIKNKRLKQLMLVAITLTLIQVILGTQVREFIDDQVKLLGQDRPELWLSSPTLSFYIHRSFSIVVVLINLWIGWINKKEELNIKWITSILILLALEVISGMIMYYFDFPFATQASHLVFASLLFGAQFYVLLHLTQKEKTQVI